MSDKDKENNVLKDFRRKPLEHHPATWDEILAKEILRLEGKRGSK